jgi:hypothetical protein
MGCSLLSNEHNQTDLFQVNFALITKQLDIQFMTSAAGRRSGTVSAGLANANSTRYRSMYL